MTTVIMNNDSVDKLARVEQSSAPGERLTQQAQLALNQPSLAPPADIAPTSPPRTPREQTSQPSTPGREPTEDEQEENGLDPMDVVDPESGDNDPAGSSSSPTSSSSKPTETSSETAAATAGKQQKRPKAKWLTRDERIGIQYLRKYGGFSYQEIFLRCERRFTMRQIQDACNGPPTPKKSGRRKKTATKTTAAAVVEQQTTPGTGGTG